MAAGGHGHGHFSPRWIYTLCRPLPTIPLPPPPSSSSSPCEIVKRSHRGRREEDHLVSICIFLLSFFFSFVLKTLCSPRKNRHPLELFYFEKENIGEEEEESSISGMIDGFLLFFFSFSSSSTSSSSSSSSFLEMDGPAGRHFTRNLGPLRRIANYLFPPRWWLTSGTLFP